MAFIETYGKELVALAVPLVSWALNTFFRRKASLLLAIPHRFTFLVQQPLVNAQGQQISPNQTVETRSIVVWNSGRETATNIEWVFNWKPMCLNLWPLRNYREHTQADGRYVIIFESLAPREHIGCEIMSINHEVPNLATVRCDQCVARGIEMYPQPILPPWKRRALVLLMLLGLGFLVYVALVVLQFLILRTPFPS